MNCSTKRGCCASRRRTVGVLWQEALSSPRCTSSSTGTLWLIVLRNLAGGQRTGCATRSSGAKLHAASTDRYSPDSAIATAVGIGINHTCSTGQRINLNPQDTRPL